MRGASRGIENELRRLGYVHVAGVDEVGRGCLAGPVVAAPSFCGPSATSRASLTPSC